MARVSLFTGRMRGSCRRRGRGARRRRRRKRGGHGTAAVRSGVPCRLSRKTRRDWWPDASPRRSPEPEKHVPARGQPSGSLGRARGPVLNGRDPPRAPRSIAMALMTTRMMVRNGAECLGAPPRRSAPCCDAPPRRGRRSRARAPDAGEARGRRRRALDGLDSRELVTTTADTAAATSASAPFKRHERIAAIKVRAPVRGPGMPYPQNPPSRPSLPNPNPDPRPVSVHPRARTRASPASAIPCSSAAGSAPSARRRTSRLSR